jgi:hypothetical protein
MSAITKIYVPTEENIQRAKMRGNNTCLPGFSEMRFEDGLVKSLSAQNKQSMQKYLLK